MTSLWILCSREVFVPEYCVLYCVLFISTIDYVPVKIFVMTLNVSRSNHSNPGLQFESSLQTFERSLNLPNNVLFNDR